MYDRIISAAEELLTHKNRIIVAIDGRCASGKSTLSAVIAEKTGCNVIHMDDFFLRPEQRTKERLSETGGNTDYERFEAEVLLPFSKGCEVTYRPYNCGKRAFDEAVNLPHSRMTLVEGSYSCHPRFYDYYDLHIFLSVAPDEQLRRLERRNPVLLSRFINEWIPMEEKYFEAFGIAERCGLKFNT
ncbi:MAG: hypothetical protein IJ416_04280 [Ruminiclostridium sp.]|nr:hypothetical protein [Ruminiclostridium sp.]